MVRTREEREREREFAWDGRERDGGLPAIGDGRAIRRPVSPASSASMERVPKRVASSGERARQRDRERREERPRYLPPSMRVCKH